MDLPEIFADENPLPWDCRIRESRENYHAPPKPYFVNEERGIRIYQGDAMELLKRTKSEMFDLIFADPPYFLSNGGITCQAGKMVSVDKGKWDKAETFEQVHAFNTAWLSECRRILKPNGTIWVSGTSHNIYSVGFAMQTLGYKILNDIAWYKVNPPPNLACRYFTHATETVLWARKDAKAKHYFNYEEMKRIGDPTPGNQMQSLWRILPPGKHEKRYGKHPTQKPEALLIRIVLASSCSGQLVADPFCGSGTTAIACARLKRRFIGFELIPEYLELAVKRIVDELGPCRVLILAESASKHANAESAESHRGIVTWAEIVYRALATLGGEGTLRDITDAVRENPRTNMVRTWPCTVRRVVRESRFLLPVGRGRYRLARTDEQISGAIG